MTSTELTEKIVFLSNTRFLSVVDMMLGSYPLHQNHRKLILLLGIRHNPDSYLKNHLILRLMQEHSFRSPLLTFP